MVTARYLVVTARYCSLLGGYWCTGGYRLLPVVTARYRLLMFVHTFSMKGYYRPYQILHHHNLDEASRMICKL